MKTSRWGYFGAAIDGMVTEAFVSLAEIFPGVFERHQHITKGNFFDAGESQECFLHGWRDIPLIFSVQFSLFA